MGELEELKETAEKGGESGLAGVTITMAILAVLVASISLLGHRAHTEELLLQTKATDQWAYYQAKDIRRRSYELFIDELSVFSLQNSDAVAKVKAKYQDEVKKDDEQQGDIEAEARKAEDEVTVQQHRANLFDLGEVLLEASLVICSITLLTRKKFFWALGLIMGALGVAVAATGLLIN
jgi:hypothetical protein